MTHSSRRRRKLSADLESTCETISFEVLGSTAACGLAPPNAPVAADSPPHSPPLSRRVSRAKARDGRPT